MLPFIVLMHLVRIYNVNSHENKESALNKVCPKWHNSPGSQVSFRWGFQPNILSIPFIQSGQRLTSLQSWVADWELLLTDSRKINVRAAVIPSLRQCSSSQKNTLRALIWVVLWPAVCHHQWGLRGYIYRACSWMRREMHFNCCSWVLCGRSRTSLHS